MPGIEIFNNDAFSLTSLTAAINKAPFKPSRLSEMGLFEESGVSTRSVWIEEFEGVLSLLQSQPRGASALVGTKARRKSRSFDIPHFPYNKNFTADEMGSVRDFGTEASLQTVATLVQRELQEMRNTHEATLEYMRMGAINGIVLDGDGTTELFNLFTDFGVTETTVDFDFGTSTTNIRALLVEIIRDIETAIGASPYDHIHGFAGPDWFDAYIDHADVSTAFARFQDGSQLRNDLRSGFDFAGVIIENYRGSVGAVKFVQDDECRFFPVGVPNFAITRWGPGTWIENIGTIGERMLAKQIAEPDGSGIKIMTQSNPLNLVLRPAALIKGTQS